MRRRLLVLAVCVGSLGSDAPSAASDLSDEDLDDEVQSVAELQPIELMDASSFTDTREEFVRAPRHRTEEDQVRPLLARILPRLGVLVRTEFARAPRRVVEPGVPEHWLSGNHPRFLALVTATWGPREGP